MKKNLLLLGLGLCFIFTLKAQVGPTGAAEIGLPLYTFSEGAISVPVGLSYDATGIRPDVTPSWVGTNWHLSAGASIHRVLRDKPDESGVGFLQLKNGTAVDNNYLGILDNGSISSALTATEAQWLFLKDSEPDMFMLNLNGNSIKFFLKYNASSNKVETIFKNQNNDVIIEALPIDGILPTPPPAPTSLPIPIPSLIPVKESLFNNGKHNNREGLVEKAKFFYFKVTTQDGLVYWLGEKPEDREYVFSYDEYNRDNGTYDFAGNALQNIYFTVPYSTGGSHLISPGRLISSPHTWHVSRIVNYKGLNTSQNSLDVLQTVNFNYEFVQHINNNMKFINNDLILDYSDLTKNPACPVLSNTDIDDIKKRPIYFSSQLKSIEGDNLKVEFNSPVLLTPTANIPSNINDKIPSYDVSKYYNTNRADILHTDNTFIPNTVKYFLSAGSTIPLVPLFMFVEVPNPLKDISKSAKLHNIVVIDKISTNKTGYLFDYDYYKTVETRRVNNIPYPKNSFSKLRLKGIYPLNFKNNIPELSNGYAFGYNTDLFETSKTNGLDHWGYMNGRWENNLSLEVPSKRDRDNYNTIIQTCPIISNKTADEVNTKKGILTSIQYPTGSTNIYEYEINDCDNYMTEVLATTFEKTGHRQVGGLRLKSILSSDPISNTKYLKKYGYKDKNNPSKSSGFLSFWPEYHSIEGNKLSNGLINGFYTQRFAPFALSVITERLVNGHYLTYQYISEESIDLSNNLQQNNGLTIYEYNINEEQPYSFYNQDQWIDNNSSSTSGIPYSKYLRLTGTERYLPKYDFTKGLIKAVYTFKRVNQTYIPISEENYIYDVEDLSDFYNITGWCNLSSPEVSINGKYISKEFVSTVNKINTAIEYASYVAPPIRPVAQIADIVTKVLNEAYNIQAKIDETKYDLSYFTNPVGKVRLKTTVSKNFDENQPLNFLETITKLEYSPINIHSKPIKITKGKSSNGQLLLNEKQYIKEIKYAKDYSNLYTLPLNAEARGIYGLIKRNINVPIEALSIVNNNIFDASYNEYHYNDPNNVSDVNFYAGFVKKNYVFELQNPVPYSSFNWSNYNIVNQTFNKDVKYEAYNFYNEYNSRGFLKSYNFNQAPTLNIDYSSVYNGYLPTTKSKFGFTTTMEYIPLYGLKKQTNAAGIFVTNEFDEKGRLKYSTDHKGFLNASYNYNELPSPIGITDGEITFEAWTATEKIVDITDNLQIIIPTLINNQFDIKISVANSNFKSIVITTDSDITNTTTAGAGTYNVVRRNVTSYGPVVYFNLGFGLDQQSSYNSMEVLMYSQRNAGGYLVGKKIINFTVQRSAPTFRQVPVVPKVIKD